MLKMGQTSARQRLEIIKENVDEITDKIKSDELTADDRNRSHDILLDYIKELNLILSKSVRASRIRKVEKLIIAALQELATLEGSFKNIEPRLKAKSLQTLHDIEKCMQNISANLNNKNLETGKEVVNNYKKRISLIEDVDHEIGATKSKVLDVVYNVESAFNELEIEKKLKEVEEKHYQSRLDLNRFVGVSDSNCYKKHKEHLQNLKDEVCEIFEISDKVQKQKHYLLFNIENNLFALDKKVEENESKIQKQIEEEIYKTTNKISNNNNLIQDVILSYTEFEKSFTPKCTLEELQDIIKQLGELKIKIEEKLQVLESQIEIQDVEIIPELIPEKESDAFEIQELIETPIPPPRINNKLKKIFKNLEDLREQIFVSKFNKESVLYKTYQDNLEECRNELKSLTLRTKDEQNSIINLTMIINDISELLQQKLVDRKSTSGDLLIDIMSVNSNINELETYIQSANNLKDCEWIENHLLENLYYLKTLEIPFSRTNICKFRDYVVIQIENNLSRLDKIKQELNKSEIVEVKNDHMLSF